MKTRKAGAYHPSIEERTCHKHGLQNTTICDKCLPPETCEKCQHDFSEHGDTTGQCMADACECYKPSLNPHHTPGPWKVVKDDEGGLVIRQQPEDGYYICELNGHAGNDPFGENNARLIAAAPDLLEALRQAVFAIPTTHGAFEVVRQAIAKAEGK